MSKPTDSRREFVKRAAYVAPAILTLMATPSFAKSGSEKPEFGTFSGGNDRSTKCHVAPWSVLYQAWTWPR